MTRVVDTADDHAALALFDDRDRCVLDLERKEAAARPADNTMQSDLNHPAVRDDYNVAVVVTFKDFVERGGHTRLEVPVGFFRPPRPRLRETLSQVICAQALPLTEVDLAQPRHRLGVLSDRRLDRLRCLESSLQVARVKACEPAAGETPAHTLGLAASLFRERWVQLALDAVLAIPRRLAVANEHQPRGRRPGSER